ncbi:MAG: MBL fold metallo-hydrolase RNA specificity domain-containing protein, partial [Verrucomicrobiales bacterium]
LFRSLDRSHKVQLNCEVDDFDFSGHAPREELRDFAIRSRAKKILLVHGDPSSTAWMQAELRQALPDSEIAIPEPGQRYEF